MADAARGLRSDARANQDRLIEVAARAFARDGVDTSLKAIAQEAGVGIGTLYRRFPSRELLVEAVYRSETERLCAAAPRLLKRHAPRIALRKWMDQFVDYLATKHGMAESLHAVLVRGGDLRLATRDRLRESIETLLAAGIADGSLRADVEANDVLMALGGITLIAGQEQQRELAGRLLDLLMSGLRPGDRD